MVGQPIFNLGDSGKTLCSNLQRIDGSWHKCLETFYNKRKSSMRRRKKSRVHSLMQIRYIMVMALYIL